MRVRRHSVPSMMIRCPLLGRHSADGASPSSFLVISAPTPSFIVMGTFGPSHEKDREDDAKHDSGNHEWNGSGFAVATASISWGEFEAAGVVRHVEQVRSRRGSPSN